MPERTFQFSQLTVLILQIRGLSKRLQLSDDPVLMGTWFLDPILVLFPHGFIELKNKQNPLFFFLMVNYVYKGGGGWTFKKE